jgi:hypothetical protein
MHTAQLSTDRVFQSWHLHHLRSQQPVWYYAALGHLLLMVACLFASTVDERLFNGVSVWVKPAKFALSLAVYFATLLVFAQLVRPEFFHRRAGRTLVGVTVVAAVGEILYITVQATLGQASHFNTNSSFHAAMYSLMGLGATVLVAALLWYAVVILRHNGLKRPLVQAVVLGLVLTFVLGGGFGGYLASQPGHWVNAAATDANGVWLFNWTRDGGDLRVAHFFGMHAMQALPLFALLLPRRLSSSTRSATIIAFACAFTAFATVTFLQALAGRPFIA